MSTTDVIYNVQVVVEVDDETGRVLDVTVDDTSAQLDKDEDPASAAVKAAESAMWLAWELGF